MLHEQRGVAKELSRNRLGTGSTVVDKSERYVGYIFNEDVKSALDDFLQRAEQDVEETRQRLSAEYPELLKRGLL